MALDTSNFGKLDAGFSNTIQQLFAYNSSDDALATIVASGYFNNLAEIFHQYDVLLIQASDDVGIYQISSATGATTVTVASIIDASIIPDGAITNAKVNAAAAIAWSKMAALTDTHLLVGNGSNVATDVAMSGDATLANTGALTIANSAINNAKVSASAAIAWSKLAALTDAHFLVGNGSNVATDVAMSGDATLANTGALTIAALAVDNGKLAANAVDNSKVDAAAAIAWSKMAALTDTHILVGNGSNVATDVAMSGDATIANTGAVTIANNAVTTAKILDSNVTEAKIAPNTLTGLVVGNTADAPVIGGIPIIFPIATAGGATANTDVTSTHKIQIIDVWVVNTGLGTAGDTIQIFNGASAVTDAIDINKADETVTRAGTIDDTLAVISAAGTLRVTETDGGGADSPSTIVYVLAIRTV